MGLFGGSSLYDTAWAAFDAVQAERQAKEAFLKEGMTEEEAEAKASKEGDRESNNAMLRASIHKALVE